MIHPAKIIRAIAGIAVLAVLAVVVFNWWGDFKSAASSAVLISSTTTTGTGSPASFTASGTVTYGLVKTTGLNFRTKPMSAPTTFIRQLKKGDKLRVLAKDGTWYQVKDAKGRVGWVTADPTYIVLQPH